MRKFLFVALLIFLADLGGTAQTFRQQIYRSYITGDMDGWEKLLQENTGKMKVEKDLYDYAMAHYGFIGYCIGRDQKQRARPWLDRVEVIADELVAKYPQDPRYYALRGALYGFRISYQPQKAMFIGPKALKQVNRALEKGPDCAQAWIENSNKDYFMPEIFGGSKVNGIAGYEKAIRMMEKDLDFIKENWYYLNVHMILASWYEQRGRSFASHEMYRKVLEIEPRFAWANEKLAKK